MADETKIPDVSQYPSVPAWKSFATDFGQQALGYGTNYLTNNILGDSEIGRVTGNLFSSGVTAAGKTFADNLLKGQTLTSGLGQNLGASLGGAGVGIGSKYLGKGITSAMGNSKFGRFLGSGIGTGAGIYGGSAISNFFGSASSVNPYGAAGQILGSAFGAANGPSKEYGGTYGNVTQTMDSIYDGITVAANAFGPVGQIVSGGLALNKGLSNLFGSTDGMTVQDAVLGSAFMPAPLKWLNMWGSNKTGTFKDQSWQNTLKTQSFMQNGFGNLQDKFDKALSEAGKTYGTFSQGAYRRAQRNLDFANSAWQKILDMSNKDLIQRIRAMDMTSINNQRYSQDITGGFKPVAQGKHGMKILNNSINHDLGQRFLSGAALIDNKQMILSKCREVD